MVLRFRIHLSGSLEGIEAHWLPMVIDPQRWRLDTALELGSTATSGARPIERDGQGTDLIEPVLRGLEERGAIEHRRLTGVSRDDMVHEYWKLTW